MRPLRKHLTGLAAMAVMINCGKAAEDQTNPPPVRGFQEVDQAQVELSGGFWGPRLKTHHDVTIPHALDELEKDGHVTNFDKAAGRFDGPLKGHHAFDSDLYKALEGALYSLGHFDDPALRQRVAGITDRILAAQQKDGFLISYLELDLPMPVRRVLANPKVEANRGKVALMRGPLVYCVEAADQPDVNLTRMILPRRAEMTARHCNDILGGVTVLEGEALADGGSPIKVTAIPFYAWQNRSKGAMVVWIQEAADP